MTSKRPTISLKGSERINPIPSTVQVRIPLHPIPEEDSVVVSVFSVTTAACGVP